MPFKGPYPTVFSGHTTAMVISHTTFGSGVTIQARLARAVTVMSKLGLDCHWGVRLKVPRN